MPELRAFHALRYAEPAGEPADLLAPPYDVVDADQARRLRERSPFNAIRLVLPEGEDRYEQAARRLRAWREDGLLRRDDEPAVWVYGQTFRHEGRERTRHGVFAAVRLSEFGEEEVLPHEETHREPREDRLRLMEACRAQLSPVFLVAPDPAGRLPALVDRAVQGSPTLDARTPDGVRHRLWRVPAGSLADELCEAAGASPTLVADGHHRYETALAMHRRRPDDPAAAWTLACVVGQGDPGLLCLPTHRSLSRAPDSPGGPVPGRGGETDGSRQAWERLLEGSFEVRDTGIGRDAAEAGARHAAEVGGGALVAALSSGPCLQLRALRRAREAAGLEPDLADVASAVFDRLVLRPAFDRGPDEAVESGLLGYHREPSEAVRAAGRKGAAFLLPPLPVERVLEIAGADRRLPPKSTYFWPKLPSGLLFRSLAG